MRGSCATRGAIRREVIRDGDLCQITIVHWKGALIACRIVARTQVRRGHFEEGQLWNLR